MTRILLLSLLTLAPTAFVPVASAEEVCNSHDDQNGWSDECVGVDGGSIGTTCVYYRRASGYYDSQGEPVTVHESSQAVCLIPLN